MAPLLAVAGLTKAFGGLTAVKDLSFTAEAGDPSLLTIHELPNTLAHASAPPP